MNTEKTGRFIADLRKEKNLTQRELADLLHVSDKAVSRWETGRGFPDISSLEDIAAVLDTSTAEILRGEKIEQAMDDEAVKELTRSSVSLVQELLQKRSIQSLLTGFLVSLILFVLAVVHLNSPVWIQDPGDALQVEELSDGRVVAVVNCPVSGWDLQDVDFEGHKETFFSCYETVLDRWTGRSRAQMILLGDKEDLERVYYYPGEEWDRLIYSQTDAPDYDGVETLPRLIYNAWTFMGACASLLCLVVLFLMRHSRYRDIMLKVTALPVSFTLSLLAVLAGRRSQVYDAVYYLSGILIVTVLLYILFLAVYGMYRKRKRA